VDISEFTYPGPKPSSKENAVLMMADSVEAASRTLKTFTSESISDLVEKIVRQQAEEDQFSEADITFGDISAIKEIFKNRLSNIYHNRIEYPELKKSH
jgi:membrane-associated HD superfamily phosphohydrolase